MLNRYLLAYININEPERSNIMKFLFVGDPHEMIKQPKNRTDDFFDTYNHKVQEIKKIAIDNDVKAIIQAGDFLDVPKVETSKLIEIINRWSIVPTLPLFADLQLNPENISSITTELSKGIPFLGVIGNHELFGEAITSYSKTSLASLEQLGFMKLLQPDKPLIFEEKGMKVALTGTHYYSSIDEHGRESDYIVDKKMGDFHIHLVHGMLSDKNLGPLIKHTTVDEIADKTQADLTLAGHDHIGFNLIEHDGKQFVNPGSLTRVKSDLKEINRNPKVLLIEVTPESGVVVQSIFLKSAPSGKAVLNRSEIEASKNSAIQMEKIKSAVNKAQLKQGTNMKTIVASVMDANHIEDSVKEDLMTRISDKMDEFSQYQSQTPAEDFTIKSLELNHFQSHTHTVFNFSKGLNVLVGESGNGKSAVLRAFDFIMNTSKKNPRDYIQVNATEASAKIVLTNGWEITRVVEQKKTGKNGYEIFNPLTGFVEEANTRYTESVLQDLLGYQKVLYDVKTMKTGVQKSVLDLNFIRQGTSWFFIGDNLKGSDRAKIIGSIFGTHYADGVIRDLEKEHKDNRKLTKIRENDVTDLTKSLNSFDYLDTLQGRIKQAESLQKKIETNQYKMSRLQKLRDRLVRANDEITRVDKVLASLPDLKKLAMQLEKASNKTRKLNSLNYSKQKIETTSKEIKHCDHQLIQLAYLPDVIKKFESIRKANLEIARVKPTLIKHKELAQKKEQLEIALNKGDIYLRNFRNLELCKKKFNEVTLKSRQDSRLTQSVKVIDTVTKEQKLNENTIKGLYKARKNLLKGYLEVLREAGTCPTCHSEVNEEKLDVIAESFR